MALSDPQSVTISGTAIPLPRTGSGDSSSVYTSADGLQKLRISHANGKRNRRTIRLEHRKVAADPFTTGINTEYGMTCYVVFDTPTVGYTVAEEKAVVDGFFALLNATSGALITKVLGGES